MVPSLGVPKHRSSMGLTHPWASDRLRRRLVRAMFVGLLVGDTSSAASAPKASVEILERSVSYLDLLSVRARIEAAEGGLPEGGRSEIVLAELDCRQKVVLVKSRTIFAGARLSGERWETFQSDPQWVPAGSDVTGALLLAAACSSGAGSDQPEPTQERRALSKMAAIVPKPASTAAKSVYRTYTLQVGSFPSEKVARAYADTLSRRLQLGRSGAAVEQASVGGRTYFRALLTLNAPVGEGASLCEKLNSLGAHCLMRAARPAPTLRLTATN